MRKGIYWFGWSILAVLPIVFAVQIYMMQDLPVIEPWKWFVPLAAVGIIYFSRDRDDVLKHHVV